MANSEAVHGLRLPSATFISTERCHDCAVGQMKRSVFRHSDVCGAIQEKSLDGTSYFLTFRDDFSGFRVVFFLKEKSQVFSHLQYYVALLHAQTGRLVAALRSDNGGEYVGTKLQNWIKKKEIRHETIVRYISQENAKSERDNLTFLNGTRTLLYSNKALLLVCGLRQSATSVNA